MTILILEEVRERALQEGRTKLAKSLLLPKASTTWSAFLSYKSTEREVAVGAAERIRSHVDGLSVYSDFEDSELPQDVTPRTADLLAQKIRDCDLLLVTCTENSPNSRWMPWEAGLAHGLGKRVALLPALTRVQVSQDGLFFHGESYYGLYPWLDVHRSTDGTTRVWANENGVRNCYIEFEAWLAGSPPVKRR